nr:hypothetical protein Iba_chr02dCG10940 [Ipomoea batatas]
MEALGCGIGGGCRRAGLSSAGGGWAVAPGLSYLSAAVGWGDGGAAALGCGIGGGCRRAGLSSGGGGWAVAPGLSYSSSAGWRARRRRLSLAHHEFAGLTAQEEEYKLLNQSIVMSKRLQNPSESLLNHSNSARLGAQGQENDHPCYSNTSILHH